jgi:hypothetical protein
VVSYVFTALCEAGILTSLFKKLFLARDALVPVMFASVINPESFSLNHLLKVSGLRDALLREGNFLVEISHAANVPCDGQSPKMRSNPPTKSPIVADIGGLYHVDE